MRNRSYSVVFIASLLMVCGISPSSSAQVLPDADLECDDSMEIDPSGFGNNLINCELTNPTAFPEKVDLTYQGGQLDIAGPESVTVGAGADLVFPGCPRFSHGTGRRGVRGQR